MVGAVQRWRKGNAAAAQPVWEALAQANSQVEEGLRQLAECAASDREEYERLLDVCSGRPSHEVRINLLHLLTSSFQKKMLRFGGWCTSRSAEVRAHKRYSQGPNAMRGFMPRISNGTHDCVGS